MHAIGELKKLPYGSFFAQSNKEKNKAVFKICGEVLSLSSEKPKLQTTTGLLSCI